MHHEKPQFRQVVKLQLRRLVRRDLDFHHVVRPFSRRHYESGCRQSSGRDLSDDGILQSRVSSQRFEKL